MLLHTPVVDGQDSGQLDDSVHIKKLTSNIGKQRVKPNETKQIQTRNDTMYREAMNTQLPGYQGWMKLKGTKI